MLTSLTVIEVSRILQEYFPSLAVNTIKEIDPLSGDIFLINDNTVFQFPLSEDRAKHLGIQLCLMPMLPSRLPLNIPYHCGVAPDPDRLPLCACYPFIKGQPLLPDEFKSSARSTRWRNSLAQQLGEFLTALHSFPTQEAVSCGLVESRYPLIEQVVRQNASVRSSLYSRLSPEEREFLNTTFKGLLWEMRDYDAPTALLHGRLTSERLLLRPDGNRLGGIIGWGGMKLGNPAIDFTWRAEYGDDFFFKVLQHYDMPLPEPEQFARVVAYQCQLLPVQQMMLALKTGSEADFECARRRLLPEQES